MKRKFKNLVTTSPMDVKDGDCFAVKIVASAGFADDWAAYRGPSHWSDQQVAESGDKISEGQAKAVFYVMRESGRSYRR